MGMLQILAASNAQTQTGSSYLFPILIVGLFGLLYFVMIRPQRNRQRRVMQMQSDITPGQRVRTTAGMYATVVSVEDADVVLEVAPGVQVRFLRRAIMDVVPEDTGVDGREPPAAPGSADGESGSVNGVTGAARKENERSAE